MLISSSSSSSGGGGAGAATGASVVLNASAGTLVCVGGCGFGEVYETLADFGASTGGASSVC